METRPLARARCVSAVLAVGALVCACSAFKDTGAADRGDSGASGPASDAGVPDIDAAADASDATVATDSPPGPDADPRPPNDANAADANSFDAPIEIGDASAGSCSPIGDCLDPSSPNVIEVPSEATVQAAFASAQAGDTIQIKGNGLGDGWRVPPYVTLHGCSGAIVGGAISFAGSGGTIEGFEVSGAGSLVANQTGTYTIRGNRFSGTNQVAGISGRSIDGIVSASVTLLVERNLFIDRPTGVVGDTDYDTGIHQVTLSVQNNVFAGVASPVLVTQAGLVGSITTKVAFNTFYAFGTAIQILHATPQATTIGNLFVQGTTAITATSPYTIDYSMMWQVTNATTQAPPLSGAIAPGEPSLVDPTHGDFHLGPGSAAIDLVPNGTQVPAKDFLGCPRPLAFAGSDPKSDLGAIEQQP